MTVHGGEDVREGRGPFFGAFFRGRGSWPPRGGAGGILGCLVGAPDEGNLPEGTYSLWGRSGLGNAICRRGDLVRRKDEVKEHLQRGHIGGFFKFGGNPHVFPYNPPTNPLHSLFKSFT